MHSLKNSFESLSDVISCEPSFLLLVSKYKKKPLGTIWCYNVSGFLSGAHNQKPNPEPDP